ncbi:unnamed protein product [Caenorhabditis angaria]|uniref:C2H2-type domain-containing protein n=1 Tax=Caenorhabditis angaria TaxID=860376 RepID=A0A9P1J229_9PELO|nr:unnamed protein product [Caenorhabditis angaria]
MSLLLTYRNPEDVLRKLLRTGRIIIEKNLGIFGFLVVNLSSQIARFIIQTSSKSSKKHPLRTPYIIEIASERDSVIPLPFENPAENFENSARKKRRICGISHLLGDEETYCCQRCFRQFSRKWNLERHSGFCEAEFRLKCPKCSKIYKKSAYLAKHLRKCPEKDENPENSKILESFAEKSTDLRKLKIPYEVGAVI